MEISDFWDEIRDVFEGEAQEIKEIDLDNVTIGGMSQCLTYLLTHAKDCNCRFHIKNSETQVLLPSPYSAINYILQEQVTVAMWLSFPALPMISVYVDFVNRISFGYVRGTWNAMNVLAFFDLMYEMKQLAPGADILPSEIAFTQPEREKILDFWQDYNHAMR